MPATPSSATIPKGRKISNIIIHHSVSNWGDGDVIVQWHTAPKPAGNGWKAPGYHFVICNGFLSYNSYATRKPVFSADGRIDSIWPKEKVSNGCKYANANSIHVCLIGDFDKHFPTQNQVDNLTTLLKLLCKTYQLDPKTAISGHGEMQRKLAKESYSKSCPGKNFNMDSLRSAVADSSVQNSKSRRAFP